jgi:hypothetical protein
MKLCVVWKSNNKIDIEKFIIPYIYNSKVQQWFDDVEVIIWGVSQETVSNSSDYEQKIKEFISLGISVYACKMCADGLNVTDVLESIGVTVIYTGAHLSDRLKDPNTEVITL